MFVVSNFINGVAFILNSLLTVYMWIVIIAALITWVNPDPYNPIVRILRNLTDPVFYRVRKWLPFTYASGIDFSPIVIILAIFFIKIFIVQSMYQIAGTMR